MVHQSNTHLCPVFIVINWTLIFFTTLGSGLVLALFCNVRRKDKRPSHYFIISLTVSDLVYGIINSGSNIYQCHADQKISDPHCFWITSVATSSAVTALLNVLATSVERYFAICHAVLYNRFANPRLSRSVLASIWAVGAIFGLSTFWADIRYLNPNAMCIEVNRLLHLDYWRILNYGVIFPSSIIIVFVYVCIYLKIRQTVS